MDSWSVMIIVAGAAFALGWWARSVSGDQPTVPSLASRQAADAHHDLLGEDVTVSGRIAAIKRLRALRPDLDLKTAKDAVDLMVSRRTFHA